MKDTLSADTPEQARLLQDFAYASVIGHLLKTEASAGEVTAATRQSVKQAHHKLTRLLAAGLIEVSGERKRGGRAVKVYRAAAQEYRIPFALTDAATFAELLQRMHQPLLSAHYRTVGETVMAHSQGNLVLRAAPEGGVFTTVSDLAPEVIDGSQDRVILSDLRNMRLRPETVRELERRLNAVGEWLAEQRATEPQEEGEVYLYGVLLTPGKLRE